MKTDRDIAAWAIALFQHWLPIVLIAVVIAFLAETGKRIENSQQRSKKSFSESVYRMNVEYCAKNRKVCR